MSRLANTRHERFALARASGKSADEAYQEAGYKPDRGHASRLAAKGNVMARVAELQAQAAKTTIINIETLTQMFIEDRALAHSEGQAAAAGGITERLAKLYGHSFEGKAEPAPTPATVPQEGNVYDFKAASKKAKA